MVAWFENITQSVKDLTPVTYFGKVTAVQGLFIEASGVRKPLTIGDRCLVEANHGKKVPCEVVSFKNDKLLLMPYDSLDGIGPGCKVDVLDASPVIYPHPSWCGRIINAFGEAIDGKGELLKSDKPYFIKNSPPPAQLRARVKGKVDLGVRAVNTFLTVCKGQRMGIFAGSGVGKSTLLGMIARNSDADVNVVALIGERGREVKEFVEDSLGEEGMAKSVLVCSTGDQPPLIRQKALLTATAVCEYFRDQGKKVFLMTDTVTRCAMAGREVGLSLGEPPTMKGYPPSIFSWLQKVLERAGNSPKGSITALYTVLMEGDDISDPIVDIVRGIVDGHIFLSRKVAESNHYPAIDVLGSISRLMSAIATPEHKEAAAKLRKILSMYRENKDLIDVGMYQPGSNPKLDIAIQMMPQVNAFLQQRTSDIVSMDTTVQTLVDMMKDVDI